MGEKAIQFVRGSPLVLSTLKIVIVFLVVSGLVAFLVYLERKVLAFMQARLGPMRVGPWGLLQALADPIKLMLKEDIVPANADRVVFLLAPVISVVAAFAVFAVIPFAGNFYISDVNIGILLVLGISSLGIYGIILGGWASNSHYPLLGALRSAAQLVSYEVAGGLAIVGVLLVANSLSLVRIVESQREMGVWFVFVQPVAFLIYLVATIAETNRNPFDLPEAESELTAGFHTEYSGFRFALFFMAEYTSMVLVSCIGVTLFFGGWLRPFPNVSALEFLKYAPIIAFLGLGGFIIWLGRRSPVSGERRFFIILSVVSVALAALVASPLVLEAIQGVFWFTVKVLAFLYAFIWYRGTFPRYRYDQLMNVGWRWLIPLGLANLIVTAVVRYWLGSSAPAASAAFLAR